MSATISIIVPTRLRNHLLPRAVRSLLAQTFGDLEILVVDDNPPEARVSTDPGLASLLQHPKVRVLTHEHPRNASAARNLGLQAARGEWITYLDDDDAYRPAKLEKQLRMARKTGLPLGICGVTYHLARRRRTRVFPDEETGGSELLLMALALPILFHRNTPEISFDEDLSAGEDAYYFYRLHHHFQIGRIFNVAEPLVDVYPQPGLRVNTNAEGLWQACQAIHRDFASAYGPVAAEVFLARAQLGHLKFQKCGLHRMTKPAGTLLRLRGAKELRFILNSFLFKLPLVRRFLVS